MDAQDKQEPLIVIPGDEDQRRGYKVGRWNKFPNYECLRCQYKTLYERRMTAHVQEGKHPWGFPNQGSDDLVDGFDGPRKKQDNSKLVY